jgi:hypothetical protein
MADRLNLTEFPEIRDEVHAVVRGLERELGTYKVVAWISLIAMVGMITVYAYGAVAAAYMGG